MLKTSLLRFVAICVLFFAPALLSGCGLTSATLITPNQAAERAENYLSEHIYSEKSGFTVSAGKDISRDGDFYVVPMVIERGGQPVRLVPGQKEFYVYVTLTGGSIVAAGSKTNPVFNLDESPKAKAERLRKTPTVPDVPKSKQPSFDVFVVSGCPYGVQIEKPLRSVVEHFGETPLPLKLHYLTSPGEDSKRCYQGYCAMHGTSEAKEDSRQTCIAAQQADKLWPYLTAFNAACSIRQPDLDQCAETAAKAAGVDWPKVQSCLKNDLKALRKADYELGQKYKAAGSPTVVINGTTQRVARSPEALLAAFCAAYEQPPAPCQQKIDPAILKAGKSAAPPAGSCGGG